MSSRRDHHWEDPYAQASEMSDSERDPGDDDVMYAEVQSFPLYTAANVVRPTARQEPLMYTPRSPARPGAYMEDAHTGQSYRFHPLDNSQVQPRTTQYTTFTSGAAPVGVGVMLDSSGSSDFFQDSLPETAAFESTAARNATRARARTPSTPASSSAAAELMHLPPMKELPPKLPSHHCAMEPPMPPPRRSRRYRRERTPDICEGRDASQKRTNHLVVLCDACRTPWQVPNTSVLLKCPNCNHVSSAMPAVGAREFSMKTDDYRFAPPRK